MAIATFPAQPAHAESSPTPTLTLNFDKTTFAYGQDDMHGVVRSSDSTANGYVSVKDAGNNFTYGHGTSTTASLT